MVWFKLKGLCGQVVSTPDFGSWGLGFEFHWSWWFFLNLNGASLHRALYVHPSIVLIWLKYCWKGHKAPNHLSLDMTKPTKWVCAQQRLRSAWAFAQSDQSHRCALNGPKVSSCGQWRLWSDWADAQADLSLRWAHIHFVGFIMSWLIYLFDLRFIGPVTVVSMWASARALQEKWLFVVFSFQECTTSFWNHFIAIFCWMKRQVIFSFKFGWFFSSSEQRSQRAIVLPPASALASASTNVKALR